MTDLYAALLAKFGSQAAIAKAFNLSGPAVSYWAKSGVPKKRHAQAQELLNSSASCTQQVQPPQAEEPSASQALEAAFLRSE